VHLAAELALLGWLSPDHLLGSFGLLGLLAVIFAECGLLVGFFLPGDTLLFTAGVLVRKGSFDHPLWYVIALEFLAAVAGNLVGYLIGYRAGPAVFRNHDARIFRPEYVRRTGEFFQRWGSWAIVLARFVPVIRTFVAVMAGAARMNFRTFAIFSVIGGALWTTGVTCLGYAFGNVALIADHVELILLAGVASSVVPIGWHYWRTRPASSTG